MKAIKKAASLAAVFAVGMGLYSVPVIAENNFGSEPGKDETTEIFEADNNSESTTESIDSSEDSSDAEDDPEDLTQYKYSSVYNPDWYGDYELHIDLPKQVYTSDTDLYIAVAVSPDENMLNRITWVTVGGESYSSSGYREFFTDSGTAAPGLDAIPEAQDMNFYTLKIPSTKLWSCLYNENPRVTVNFASGRFLSGTKIYAYAATDKLQGKTLYKYVLNNDYYYDVNGTYNIFRKTWTAAVRPSAVTWSSEDDTTAVTVNSYPNILAKLNSLSIGGTEIIADGEPISSTVGDPVIEKTDYGYQIRLSNRSLQSLKPDDWIRAEFGLQDFDLSNMTISAESGIYKSNLFTEAIRPDSVPIKYVDYNVSYDYDKSKQIWTVKLSDWSDTPNILNAAFTELKGTGLAEAEPSVTVDGTLVETEISGNMKDEYLIRFLEDAVNRIKPNSEVVFAFPVDTSKNQNEEIKLHFDTGIEAPYHRASFTIGNPVNTPDIPSIPSNPADSSSSSSSSNSSSSSSRNPSTNSGSSSTSSSVKMFRLYNPNSGEHFYTADAKEKAALTGYGWKDEGTAWTAPKSSDIPVYRLYNKAAGDHHYTTDCKETESLIKEGWSFEGVGWYSAENKAVPVYRQYNPNARTGSHNYTTSLAENNHLVSVGWHDEGIAWYGLKR
ncbi:hypothetical protein IM774_08460 [Erysipelotrichaceae bacterium RD49]|nr:hypothetical protein [Erysipelotrichaceae bacterium RD49]